MKACLFCAAIVVFASQAVDQDAATIVADAVKPFLEKKKHVTVAVGIITPAGKQEFGFGKLIADRDDSQPDAHTLYEIGSITKVFTGTLLAQLVLEKRLKLDEPVQPSLPAEWKLPRRDDRDIAFLHLATHTSGLPVQPKGFGWSALLSGQGTDPYGKFDSAALARALGAIELERPIGCKHEYSNLGVGLLGHALARADGAESYEALVTKRILKPLGMDETSIQLSDERKRRIAPGHNQLGMAVGGWNFATLEACGGIRSNVHDMLRFTEAAMGKTESPLKPAFDFAQQPWHELEPDKVEVGLCWMRSTSKRRGLAVWHNGGTGGYASFMGFRPKSGVGVVILCSGAERDVDDLGMKILNSLAK